MSSTVTPRDPVIGLDVGGRVFYCHRSTITSAEGSYFAARFHPDSMLPPGDAYRDDRGRDVYFIDRNGRTFEYVLEYLRTHALPELPEFNENRPLWRALREEATFYGLDDLRYLLQVTYSCSPAASDIPGGDRGVLYWLGTDRGRSKEYQNPYALGAIDIGGDIDETIASRTDRVRDLDNEWDVSMGCRKRADLVLYRPKTESPWLMIDSPLSFGDEDMDKSIYVDLREVSLRPTHYSLRYGDCGGLTADWAFEASTDGEVWVILHEAKSDCYIPDISGEELAALRRTHDYNLESEGMSAEDCSSFLTSYAELHYRRTYELQGIPLGAFYRFFRIRKVGTESGLHGGGFELFGDVYEA